MVGDIMGQYLSIHLIRLTFLALLMQDLPQKKIKIRRYYSSYPWFFLVFFGFCFFVLFCLFVLFFLFHSEFLRLDPPTPSELAVRRKPEQQQ